MERYNSENQSKDMFLKYVEQLVRDKDMGRYNNGENPLKDMFLKYVDRIESLQASKNIEELQKTVNQVINILPSNVTSFSIPIYNDTEEPTFVRSERVSELPEDQQKEWSLSDLIEYSITIGSIGDYYPVD